MFENRVLRGTFGPKWDEVTGSRRKMHNEELDNMYFSPSIIRTIKSKRMRWTGHVAPCGQNFYEKARRKQATRRTKK
jgi:hypothetical protein